jgi:hypothetical protein
MRQRGPAIAGVAPGVALVVALVVAPGVGAR